MTKALRGINLGGWLIAEQWMTPHLFNDVINNGERALVQELGYQEAEMRLKKHRKSFITEADIAQIAKAGYDFVRLPVGYWLFEHTNRYVEGEVYVRHTFDWAEKHGLWVVLDFHGLQGSQNGYDHSGEQGKIRLYCRKNRRASLRTLEYLCKTYGQSEALIGLEVINESQIRLGWYDWWRVLRYYDHAVKLAERYLRPDTKIIVSDAFKPLKMARALSRRGYSSRVVLDIHLYQIFGEKYQPMTLAQHLEEADTKWSEVLTEASALMPVMIGEWSAALPAAAYTGIEQHKEVACAEYFLAQQNLFDETTWAHSYWSYKAPSSGVWDSRKISELVKKHKTAR
jgi:glucan 1,3-beta-glucosidase